MKNKRIWAALGLGTLGLGVLAAFMGGDAEAAEGGGSGGGGSGGGDSGGGGSGGGGSGGGEIPVPVFPVYTTPQKLHDALVLAGLSSDWQIFFEGIARGESGFISNVVLGDPALLPVGARASSNNPTIGMLEAQQTQVAYQRQVESGHLANCGFPASRYTYGTAGWWAMMPPNAWAAYYGTPLECRDPWLLLHPADQIVCAIEMARRLMGWSAFKANPTWLVLRQGWGNPSRMDDEEALDKMAVKFAKHLEANGVAPKFMDGKPSALPPKNVEALHAKLLGALT